MTNLAVAQALAGDVSHVLIDERAHSSLADGARFFDCPVVRFPHRNATRAAAAAQRCGRSARLILLTDGLFAHSGEVAPLHDYLRLLPAGARLLVDDAHGAGVLGRRGRGTAEHLRVPARRLIRTVSLGKALGVGGGAVLGPAALCRRIIERSRLFAGHTPLALPLVAAARASLRLLSEDFRMRRRLVLNTGSVKAALRAAGFPVPDGPGPIIAFRAGSRREAALLAGRLRAAGVHPPLIQYPGGPAEGYFRFVISSEHTAEQLDTLVDVLLAPPRIRALPG
jgi:7-keto-8-aminopelargonate synthetase-like enzyme